MTSFLKDPAAVLDFSWDWSAWLGSDTISTATVTAESGLTVNSSGVVGGVVTGWLSGGSVGITYMVTCQVVTVGGRTDERSISILCRQR
jgi:hypothetical protein